MRPKVGTARRHEPTKMKTIMSKEKQGIWKSPGCVGAKSITCFRAARQRVSLLAFFRHGVASQAGVCLSRLCFTDRPDSIRFALRSEAVLRLFFLFAGCATGAILRRTLEWDSPFSPR